MAQKEQVSSLFLLNPANATYLKKQMARPAFKESSVTELGIVLAVFLVSLIIFLILAVPTWQRWINLNNNGVITQGQVSAIRFEDRDVDYFYVRYAFNADGTSYEQEQRIPLDQFETLVNTDQNLPVHYVPANPSLSRLGDPFTDFADFRVPGTMGGILWLGILLVALLYHGDKRMQNSELTAKGRLLRGTVVNSWGNKPEQDGVFAQILFLLLSTAFYRMRRRNQSQFKVKVQYKFLSPVSNKEIKKTEMAIRNDLDRRYLPDPGTPVAILYRTDKHHKLM